MRDERNKTLSQRTDSMLKELGKQNKDYNLRLQTNLLDKGSKQTLARKNRRGHHDSAENADLDSQGRIKFEPFSSIEA
jgi:hypothetical protein